MPRSLSLRDRGYLDLDYFYQLQSETPAIVEGLIWAALCVAFLKRVLAHWTQLVHRRPIR